MLELVRASKILLVEDDYIISAYLTSLLYELGDIEVFHVDSVPDALNILENNNIDLILSDIMLSEHGKTGIDLGAVIHENYSIPLLYITAHHSPEIILSAKKTRPFGYLVKPVKKEDFIVNVILALKESELQQSTNKDELLIQSGKTTYVIQMNDLLWVESDSNYVVLNFKTNKRLLIRQTISNLEKTFASFDFIRVHKSFLINKKELIKANTTQLELSNGKIVPIGRNYTANILLN